MVAVVAPETSPAPFSSRVRWLESPSGRTLQKLCRFLAEWRAAAVLFLSMYNVIVKSREAVNGVRRHTLLSTYVATYAENTTLLEARDTILDYSDLEGSWADDLFGGSPVANLRLLGLIVAAVLLAANTIVIAIPIVIQSYGIFALAYAAAWAWKVPHNIAAPCAMIGTSNFFELAVAVAIGLFGLSSGAALATVVGVLVEVPVMLSLVAYANRTRNRFPAA